MLSQRVDDISQKSILKGPPLLKIFCSIAEQCSAEFTIITQGGKQEVIELVITSFISNMRYPSNRVRDDYFVEGYIAGSQNIFFGHYNTRSREGWLMKRSLSVINSMDSEKVLNDMDYCNNSPIIIVHDKYVNMNVILEMSAGFYESSGLPNILPQEIRLSSENRMKVRNALLAGCYSAAVFPPTVIQETLAIEGDIYKRLRKYATVSMYVDELAQHASELIRGPYLLMYNHQPVSATIGCSADDNKELFQTLEFDGPSLNEYLLLHCLSDYSMFPNLGSTQILNTQSRRVVWANCTSGTILIDSSVDKNRIEAGLGAMAVVRVEAEA
ncbi:MAG: hypothetical protein NUV82_00400 [Candidatus Komeilibacteria bacterium]|nr:hypothetical protein [Candidatus Komeilibacteria bacterium]